MAPHDPLAPGSGLRAQLHRGGAADLLVAPGERALPSVAPCRDEGAQRARRADLDAEADAPVAADLDATDREAVVGRRGRLALRRVADGRLRGRPGLRLRLGVGLLEALRLLGRADQAHAGVAGVRDHVERAPGDRDA